MSKPKLWINGRFLGRPITGVERVAHNVIFSLSHIWQAQAGSPVELAWAVPHALAQRLPARIAGIQVVGLGTLDGHAWEQWDLARLPAQDWVLSLCNTGPMFRKRHALFMHDAQVFALPQNFRRSFRWWYRWMFGVASVRAQCLFTNSHFSRQELAKYLKVDAGRWTVCHLGVDHQAPLWSEQPATVPHTPGQGSSPATPALTEAELRLLQGLPQGFVLAVSSHNPNKNFKLIVQALNMMQQQAPVCVIVGGQGSGAFEKAQLSSERIIEVGYASEALLTELYRRALCLIYPSFYEGFGLPPLEAMSQGCPVVVSHTSSLPEVCGDAAQWIDPTDPASLVVALRTLMQQPERSARLGLLGREQAARYRWHLTAQRLWDAMVSVETKWGVVR